MGLELGSLEAEAIVDSTMVVEEDDLECEEEEERERREGATDRPILCLYL